MLTPAGLASRLASAAAQPWPVAPASGSAQQIAELFWLTVVLSAVVFVLVEGLLITSALRFRRRAPVPSVEPPQIHGNARLEIMWASVPALILIGLFAASVRTMGALAAAPPEALRVEVISYQWAWDFRYPDAGVQTHNELYVPVGRPVVFDVTTRDVIHAFWAPRLGGKIDAVPGRVNRTWFEATQPGRYRGVCAEFCGLGHAAMLFTVVALPPEEFARWLQDQQAGAAQQAAAGPSPERGRELFAARGCGGCHTLAAVPGASGQVGPNLDGIGTRAATRKPGLDAEAYLRESIQAPNAFVVPGYPPAMPQLPLGDDELAALVELLRAQR